MNDDGVFFRFYYLWANERAFYSVSLELLWWYVASKICESMTSFPYDSDDYDDMRSDLFLPSLNLIYIRVVVLDDDTNL